MKTTKRFERAVTKLYSAFHEGILEVDDCKYCAVGNMLGHGEWFGSSETSYIDDKLPVIEKIRMDNNANNVSGYSLKELAKVEYIFIVNVGLEETKETQFKGLEAVIEYLAELDNIPNPMDYSKLFEYTEENEPKYELVL